MANTEDNVAELDNLLQRKAPNVARDDENGRDSQPAAYSVQVPSCFKTFEDLIRTINPSGFWQLGILAQCFITMTLLAMLGYEESYLLAGRMQYRCIDETMNITEQNV